jgi:hypothetical protein
MEIGAYVPACTCKFIIILIHGRQTPKTTHMMMHRKEMEKIHTMKCYSTEIKKKKRHKLLIYQGTHINHKYTQRARGHSKWPSVI